jgi:hypothetical protein
MAQEMAAVLGDSAGFRLSPIAAGGAVENLRDLISPRGVDMAIVPANVLAQGKALEARLGAGLVPRVAHVTHLYAEEVHLLVGSRITAIEELRGARLAVPSHDGNAEFTALDLFGRLGVEVEIVRLQPPEAIEQLRSGELPAVLLIGGKPIQLVSALPKDGRLRLLNLPFSAALDEAYLPAVFRGEDYPSLIPAGLAAETVAVSAVLMANTSRSSGESARKFGRFVPLFFGGMADQTMVGSHPKWKELNLATTLPGWNRLPQAEEWLRNAREQQEAFLQRGFDEFLRTLRQRGSKDITPEERKKLFEQFVDWIRQSVGASGERVRP